MFDFLDSSSYGKADIIPNSVALMIGLLWATFVPYRNSEKCGLHPVPSLLRAIVVCGATFFSFEINDVGYAKIASVVGIFAAGYAISPSFIVSPPVSRLHEPNFFKRKILDFSNNFLDGKFAKLVVFIISSALSWLLGLHAAIWVTTLLAAFLMITKIGKSHEIEPNRIARISWRINVLGLFGSACMCMSIIAFTSISGNLAKLHLSDFLSFLIFVFGQTVGVIF